MGLWVPQSLGLGGFSHLSGGGTLGAALDPQLQHHSPWVVTVLHCSEANTLCTGCSGEGQHQPLEETTHFAEVAAADGRGAVQQEHDVSRIKARAGHFGDGGRSDHDLFLEPISLHAPLPLPALWSLGTSCWGLGSSPYLLCRQAPASTGLSALEEPRWWPQATPWSIGGEGESPEPGVYLGLRLASGAQRGVT